MLNSVVWGTVASCWQRGEETRDRVEKIPYIIRNNMYTSDFLKKEWNITFLFNLTKKIG